MTETTNSEPCTESEAVASYNAEEHEVGRRSAEQVAYLWMAKAWIDRWKALGGDFSLRFNSEGEPEGLMRGMTCIFETLEPTDRDREDLPPHTWLVDERHHEGAVKALEGLLVLCPGLRDAVRELGLKEAYGRYMRPSARA